MNRAQMVKQLAMSWNRTGEELEARRREELRTLDHLENAALINDLVAMGLAHAREKGISGLVEQQAHFLRIRSKLRETCGR